MNETRIRQLAAILCSLVVVLVVALHDVMVTEHLEWRVRAQQNHLDFRGTPSSRGSILLANGAALAEDEAGFDLEFNYRKFRRQHPVGAAVHGANLLRAAHGLPPYRWTDPKAPWEAFDALTRIEGTHLSVFDELSARPDFLQRLPRYSNRSSLSRDLGFYLSSLVSQLSDLPFQRIHARLAERAGQPGRVLEALEGDLRADFGPGSEGPISVRAELRQRYAERWRELRGLADRIEDERRQRRELFESRHPASSEEQRLERERTPQFDLFRRLEDLRESSENLADSYGAPAGGRDALQDPDFWCWLASKRRRRLDSVRSWFEPRGLTRKQLEARQREEIDTFVDKARPARQEYLRRRIDGLKASVESGREEIVALLDRLDALGLGAEGKRAGVGLYARIDAARAKRKARLAELKSLLADQRLNVLWRPESLVQGGQDDSSYRPPLLLDETRERAILREIGFEFAMSIETRADRHPGFGVRRTAHREVAEDLGGLAPYLGTVSRVQLDDLVAVELRGRYTERDPEGQVDDIADSFEQTGVFRFGAGDEARAAGWQELLQSLRGFMRTSERVGRSGVEFAMDQTLRGTPGLRAVDEMRSGRETALRGVAEVVPGADVTLTIDPDLQRLADGITSVLAPAEERALVVLDARSGDVLALSGFGPVVRPTRAEPDLELQLGFNKAATFPTFDPSIGSVIKPLIALEYLDGLRRGRYEVPFSQFETCRFSNPRGVRYRAKELQSRSRFGCERDHGSWSQDVVTALQHSCNIFFYETFWYSKDTEAGPVSTAMTQRIGWRRNDARNEVVGLDPRMHLSPHEGQEFVGRTGDVFGRAPMVRTVGYDFRVSALDIARAYAMVASGRNPAVGLIHERERVSQSLGWHPDDLASVREGLRLSLFAGSGARRGADLRRDLDPGLVDVAHGKTGTAFVQYSKETGREIYNSWFASFLGTGDQAGIVVVAVAYRVPGGTGEKYAGKMVTNFYRDLRDTPEARQRYYGRFE